MTAPFVRPPPNEIAAARRLLAPFRALFDPVFVGLDRVPLDGRPLLFVGNHTLYGALDAPHLWMELHDRHDLFLRGLGEHAHFKIPGWGALLTRWGIVDGRPEVAGPLLAAGEPVLVFPGGTREVAKRRSELYQLVWKQRLGFARLAIEHGATVMPFGMLGADEAWTIVREGQELVEGRAGRVLKPVYRALGMPLESVWPLALGVLGTPFPRPVRLYFHVGAPIDARRFAGAGDDGAWALRRETEASIYAGLDTLRSLREEDPGPMPLRRALRAVRVAVGREG